MSAEEYMDWKEHSRYFRLERQKDNTENLYSLAGMHEFEIKKIADHHLRLFLKDFTLDYFPQRGRATKLGTNRWFTISDIEQYIETIYK